MNQHVALVTVPTLSEQIEIVSALDIEFARLRDATGAAQGEIDFIREYRTRLIADVVTGKLDVREATAGLPEETEEAEPLFDGDRLVDEEAETTDETLEEAVP